MSRDLHFDINPRRPEDLYGTPGSYYSAERVAEYAQSSAMRRMQRKLAARALELIEVDADAWVADLGCGTGFGQELLVEAGLHVIGVDLALSMLARGNPKVGPRVCADLSALPFRDSSFDAVISISALQWLLGEDPLQRQAVIHSVVGEIERVLWSGGSVVIQFYPRTDQALGDVKGEFGYRPSFDGQVVIDNPHSPKKRKIFLVAVKHG